MMLSLKEGFRFWRSWGLDITYVRKRRKNIYLLLIIRPKDENTLARSIQFLEVSQNSLLKWIYYLQARIEPRFGSTMTSFLDTPRKVCFEKSSTPAIDCRMWVWLGVWKTKAGETCSKNLSTRAIQCWMWIWLGPTGGGRTIKAGILSLNIGIPVHIPVKISHSYSNANK